MKQESNQMQKSNFKKGCSLLLMKAAGAIAIVALIEIILSAITNKDQSLTPFHNHYYFFSTFYLTDPGIGSEFSESPFATTRFIIYFILGYLIYAVINVIWLIPPLKKFADRVNSILLAMLLIGAFLVAFFFPPRVSIIDTTNKEIRVTRYSWLFIPTTTHVSFSDIDTVQTGTTYDYDGYTSKYIIDLVISITSTQGEKISLGKIQVDEQSGSPSHAPIVNIPTYKKQWGDEGVRMIDGEVKKRP